MQDILDEMMEYDKEYEYCCFFIKNLQETAVKDFYAKGVCSLMFYFKLGDEINNDADDSLKDEDLRNTIIFLIKELRREKGMELDFKKLVNLCKYLRFVIAKEYIILLKPTIKDTLAELKEVTAITFKNKDGATISTENSMTIDCIMEALESNQDKLTYEPYQDGFIDRLKFTNKVLLQYRFVKCLSAFFNAYFPEISRKTNSNATSNEQELIMYMMKVVKLVGSIESPLDSYRKIISEGAKKEHLEDNLAPLTNNGVTFIKYEDWKVRGKSDWLNSNIEVHPFTEQDQLAVQATLLRWLIKSTVKK